MVGEDGPEPPTDGDTPESVLRTVVERAIDENLRSLDNSLEIVERGDEPGPTTRLPALVVDSVSVVGVVPRIDPSLVRKLGSGEDTERSDGVDVKQRQGTDPEIRLVFTGRAGNRLGSPSGVAIRTLLANRGVNAFVHEGDSPVGILLVGDRAIVGLFDDGGLAALLWTDALAVREWAAGTCRRYFAAADRM